MRNLCKAVIHDHWLKPFGPSLVRNLAERGFRTCSVQPLTPSVMAHPFTPLFLLAAVAFAAPDVLATPVQGLRGAISNSTGKARPVAQANLSAPGDDVESGGESCCKHGDDETECHIEPRWDEEGNRYKACRDEVDGSGAGCGIHGFSAHCCPASDVGIAWFIGGCH